MKTNEERIAVLEAQLSNVDARLVELIEKQDTLLENFTKYKGFVGGIMFTFSALASAIGMAIAWAKNQS